ncbi:unnamed protein product [Paramecium sonneborni]|uniref:MORN repeat protein n=1 Tax=Paramecium sonneborni TaxID=65129 RepID=A0A8S1RL94_9CILI|nr:unnamed protein product [Paramecium sonneborni]
MYCKYNEKELKQIGGGFYDEEGNEKKIGKWVELDDKNYDQKQFTYNGEYNVNGRKVGRWDTMYCKYNEKELKQIGGGFYDEEGNEKKIGKWVELDKNYDQKQFTYNGEYNVNGRKVGRWDTMYCKYNEKELKQMQILISIFQQLVVVDFMIKMEIRQRLESGQNQIKNLITIIRSYIVENIIQIV